ncbi:hypothetical protein CPB86DRAFT_785299 [Serendipita vermifera]|nr:hypothetical protein CPB86DRAFT_785299 [Serendipita vermifera]
MSDYFQPPSTSTGARTIYSVLSQAQRDHENDKAYQNSDNDMLSRNSPAPSQSSFASGSGSSYAPSDYHCSSPRSNSSPCLSPRSIPGSEYYPEGPEVYGEHQEFDATDSRQLYTFVPNYIRASIDAAKFASLGDFGEGICWEALPAEFGFPANGENPTPAHYPYPTIDLSASFVPFHDLSLDRQIMVNSFLYKYRELPPSIEEISQIAYKTNL